MVGHRPRGRLVAFAILAAVLGGAQALVAAMVLLFGGVPHGEPLVPAAVGVLVAGLVTVGAGGAAANASAGAQRRTAALTAIVVAQLVVAAVAGALVIHALVGWHPRGVDVAALMWRGLVIVGCAGTALAAALLSGRRPAIALAAVVTFAGAATAAWGAVADRTRAGCEPLPFDRERWTRFDDVQGVGAPNDRQLMAAALRDCEALDGWTRDEVHRLLGAPDPIASRNAPGDRWPIGWVHDGGMGIGDGDELVVRYGPDRRVVSVTELHG